MQQLINLNKRIEKLSTKPNKSKEAMYKELNARCKQLALDDTTTDFELQLALLQIINNDCTALPNRKYAIAGYNKLNSELLVSIQSITKATAYRQIEQACFSNMYMVLAVYENNKFKLSRTFNFTKVFD